MAESTKSKNPLDAVFAAPGHVAILRVLSGFQEGSSGRRIAREAGINHQACAEGLRRLETLGLVNREIAGRAHAFSLNAGHPVVDDLIRPLYRSEGQLGKPAPVDEEIPVE